MGYFYIVYLYNNSTIALKHRTTKKKRNTKIKRMVHKIILQHLLWVVRDVSPIGSRSVCIRVEGLEEISCCRCSNCKSSSSSAPNATSAEQWNQALVITMH